MERHIVVCGAAGRVDPFSVVVIIFFVVFEFGGIAEKFAFVLGRPAVVRVLFGEFGGIEFVVVIAVLVLVGRRETEPIGDFLEIVRRFKIGEFEIVVVGVNEYAADFRPFGLLNKITQVSFVKPAGVVGLVGIVGERFVELGVCVVYSVFVDTEDFSDERKSV